MENILLIILAVFGILQIILFFKVWEATNDVKKIRKIQENTSDITSLDFEAFAAHFNSEFAKIEKMIAIGDNKGIIALKGLKYDTEKYFGDGEKGGARNKELSAWYCNRLDNLIKEKVER